MTDMPSTFSNRIDFSAGFSAAPRLLRATIIAAAVMIAAGCATPTGSGPAATPVEAPAAPAATQAAKPTPAQAAVPAQEISEASTEKIAALRQWTDQQNRLYVLAAPILINNAALCKRQARHLLGFTAKTRHSFGAHMTASAQAGLGLDDKLRVTNVLPGSGAEKIGIRRGDILHAVEQRIIAQGSDAERNAGEIISNVIKNRTSLNLTFLRDDQRVALDVPLTHACAFGIELGDSDEVNSYSDGYRVLITRGMLNFAESDDELAYALGKEIAHAILAQPPRPRMRAIINALQQPAADKPLSGLAAPQPYSPVLDATADKLALYLLARADYQLDDVLPFWKRLAAKHPASRLRSHTALHPHTPYRMSVMTQVLQRIKAKRAQNRPLLPSVKL